MSELAIRLSIEGGAMEGLNRTIADILHPGNHYRIPGYQRNYQWTSALWQGLVSDILIAATSPDNAPRHWLGILLTSQSSSAMHPGFSGQVDYEVIDGQQRLTTIAIWVAALVHHGQDSGQNLDYSLDKLATLTVQESDRKGFQIVMENTWRRNDYFGMQKHQIVRAYTYFRYILWLGQEAIAEEDPVKIPEFKKLDSEQKFESQWEEFVNSKRGQKTPRGFSVDVEELLRSTLGKLSIYSLVHNPVTDETQAEIFDTLNGKHQELEPLDHVRNSLFVRINNLEATTLYQEYWYPAETALRKVSLRAVAPGKAFIYDYVISKGEKKRQKTINTARGFSNFSTMIKGLRDADIPAYIMNDLVPAMLTWQVVVRAEDKVMYNGLDREFSKDALRHMTNIRDLSAGPANPVVLHYATGFVTGQVTDAQLTEALYWLENYLVRIILVGRDLSPLRAKLINLMGTIDGDYQVEKLKKALKDADWVSDAELKRKVSESPLYSSAGPKALGAIFRGIERGLSGSGSMLFEIGKKPGNYSIEHIYPQKNSNWLADIALWGSPVELYENKKHTLGNLTVATIKHNSTVGNKSFAEKKAYPTIVGAVAPLSLNKDWLDESVQAWTPALIDHRSHRLLESAIEHWKSL